MSFTKDLSELIFKLLHKIDMPHQATVGVDLYYYTHQSHKSFKLATVGVDLYYYTHQSHKSFKLAVSLHSDSSGRRDIHITSSLYSANR